MADSYTITVPQIDFAAISPTEVDELGSYTVTATISEKTIVLHPVFPYSGQIYSGQNIIYLGG